MAMSEKTFSIDLKLMENYLFQIDFGDAGLIYSDEPAPLGQGEGPAPSGLLAAAVANCLAASLMFAIRKYKGDPGEVTANVSGAYERVEGRLRIKQMDVQIQLDNNAEQLPDIDKVIKQFEDFCVVTQSVKDGIDVAVSVNDKAGNKLK